MSSNRDGPASGISTRKRARDTTSGGYYSSTFLNPALLTGEVRTRYQARLFTLDAALDQITAQRQYYANYIQSFTSNTNTGITASGTGTVPSSSTLSHPSTIPVLFHTNNASKHIVGYDTEQTRSYALAQAIHARRLRRRLLHSIESITPADINTAKDQRDNRSATTAERRYLLNRHNAILKEYNDKLSVALPSTVMLNAILAKLETNTCTLGELFTYVAQYIANMNSPSVALSAPPSNESNGSTLLNDDRTTGTNEGNTKNTALSPLRSIPTASVINNGTAGTGTNLSFDSFFIGTTSPTNTSLSYADSWNFRSRVLELCSSLQNTNILRIVQQHLPLSASTLLGLPSSTEMGTDDSSTEEITCDQILRILSSSPSSSSSLLSQIYLSLNLPEYSHFASTIGRTLTTEPVRWQNIQNFQNSSSSSTSTSSSHSNNLSKSPDKSKRKRLGGNSAIASPAHSASNVPSATITPYGSPTHAVVSSSEPDSPWVTTNGGDTKLLTSSPGRSTPSTTTNQPPSYNLDQDSGLLSSLLTPSAPFSNLDILTTSLGLTNPVGKKQKSSKDKESREILSQIYGVGDSTALLSLLPTNIRTNGYSGSLYDAGSLITPSMAVLVPPTRLPYESTDKFIIENAVRTTTVIRENKPDNDNDTIGGTNKRTYDQPLQLATRVQSLLETTGYRRRRPVPTVSTAATAPTTVTDTNTNTGNATTLTGSSNSGSNELHPIPETEENEAHHSIDSELPIMFEEPKGNEERTPTDTLPKEHETLGNDKSEPIKTEPTHSTEGSVVNVTVVSSILPTNSTADGEKSTARSVATRNDAEQARLAAVTANTISRYGYTPSTNPLFPPSPPNRIRLNDPTGRPVYLTIDKAPVSSSSSSTSFVSSSTSLLHPFLQTHGGKTEPSVPFVSPSSTFSAIPSVVVPTAVHGTSFITDDDPHNVARMPLIPLPSYGLPTYTSFQDPASEALRLIKGTLGDYWQILPHVRRGADNGPLDDVSLRYAFPSTSAIANGSALAGAYVVRESLYTSPTAPIDGIPVQTSFEYDWSKEIAPLFGPPPSAIVDEDGDFVINNPDHDNHNNCSNNPRRNSNPRTTSSTSIVDEEAFEWDSKFKKRKRNSVVTESLQTPVRGTSESYDQGTMDSDTVSDERGRTMEPSLSSSPLLSSTTNVPEIRLISMTVDTMTGESQSVPAKIVLQPYREGAPQIAIANEERRENTHGSAMDISNDTPKLLPNNNNNRTVPTNIRLSPIISPNDLLAPPYKDLGESMVAGTHESRHDIVCELQLEPVRPFMSRTLDESQIETVTVPTVPKLPTTLTDPSGLVNNPLTITTTTTTVTYQPSIATFDHGQYYRPLSNWDRWETVKIERKLQYERERLLEKENAILRNNSSNGSNSITNNAMEITPNESSIHNSSSTSTNVTAGTGISQTPSVVTVPVSPRLPRMGTSPNIRRITSLQNEIGTIDSDEDLDDSVYERLHIIKNAYIERRFDERQKAVHKEELARKEKEKDNVKLPRPPPKARALLPGNSSSSKGNSAQRTNSYGKGSVAPIMMDTSPTDLPPVIITSGSNVGTGSQTSLESNTISSPSTSTSAHFPPTATVYPSSHPVTLEAPYGKLSTVSTDTGSSSSSSLQTMKDSSSLPVIASPSSNHNADKNITTPGSEQKKIVSRSGRKVIPKSMD